MARQAPGIYLPQFLLSQDQSYKSNLQESCWLQESFSKCFWVWSHYSWHWPPTILYNNNDACVKWSYNMTSKATRQIELHKNSICEWVQDKTLTAWHIFGKINPAGIFTKEMRDGAHSHRLWDSFMSCLSDFLCNSIIAIHHTTQHSPNTISPAVDRGCTSGVSSGYFTALSSLSFFCILTYIYPTCAVRDDISFAVLMDLFLPTSFEYLLSLSLLPAVLSLRNPLAFSFLLLDARIGGVGLSLVH